MVMLKQIMCVMWVGTKLGVGGKKVLVSLNLEKINHVFSVFIFVKQPS